MRNSPVRHFTNTVRANTRHFWTGFTRIWQISVASKLKVTFVIRTDTRWRSWLRHCTTSRKVAGLIPGGSTGIFLFRPHYGTGVDSASNKNEYLGYFLGGKGGWCVRLTNLLASCVDCLKIWEPQPPGTLRACPEIALPFTFRHFQCQTRLPKGKR
jgi:hypothetical protein